MKAAEETLKDIRARVDAGEDGRNIPRLHVGLADGVCHDGADLPPQWGHVPLVVRVNAVGEDDDAIALEVRAQRVAKARCAPG